MKKSAPLYPVLYMVVLSAVFGAAVSTVAVVTRPRVEAGERARFRSHVLASFGADVPENPAKLEAAWTRRVIERADGRGPYYAWVEGETLRGYAFPFRGPGFWGPIEGVLAVTPSGDRILGISFTRHQETPGLGGRISEPWFRDQFRNRPLTIRGEDLPILDFVSRPPAAPHEVEAITGATQTSTRLARFLNRFLRELPRRPALSGGEG